MALHIPISLRIGLWEAHGRRCTYCGNPLGYRELEIDHIIPQHLRSNGQALAQLLSTLELPSDFDLNDRLNLLPVHSHCNGKKSGMVFQPQNIRFYLELVSRLADRVTTEEEQYIRRSRGDRILAALQLALQSGDLSREQVAKFVNPARSEDAFEVLQSVEFSSRIVTGLLGRAEAAPLLDEPLLPRRHGLDQLRMAHASGEKRSVRTSREWADATSAGFYPLTNYDIKEEALFKRAYSLIQAFSKASVAEASFVEVSQAGLDSLDLLPVTQLPALSRDDVETLAALNSKGASVGDMVRTGEAKIDEASRNYLSLTYNYLGKTFWAILRSDLNNDGIEDMLVSTYEWATEGTLGFGNVIVLTRCGHDEKFQVAKGIDLLPGRNDSVSWAPDRLLVL
jgi:hypothetical protein